MASKRKRSNTLPNWGAKKKRTTKNRRSRFKRKQTDSTTRDLRPRNLIQRPLTKRKLRSYRRDLWSVTNVMTKFHAVTSGSSVFTGPTSQNAWQINILAAFTSTTPFWQTTGGLLSNTINVAPTSLTPDNVVIRGGTFNMLLGSPLTAVDDITVRVQLVYPKQQQRREDNTVSTNVPITDYLNTFNGSSAFQVGTTMQMLPDYSEYLYPPVMDKQMILKPGETWKFERKIKMKRIDCDAFLRGYGPFPYFIIYLIGTFDTTADPLRVTSGYDLSFVDFHG